MKYNIHKIYTQAKPDRTQRKLLGATCVMARKRRLIVNKGCFLICLALALLMCSPVLGQTIGANDDTYTYSGSSGTNYDNQGILVKYSPTRYGWVEFTTGSSAVSQATLRIYSTNSANQPIELRAAQYNFSEGSLTWSNQPNADSWTLLGNWNVVGTGWSTLDITSFYNSNLGKTITIRLKGTSPVGDGPYFEDREKSRGTSNTPRIDYVIVSDTQPPSVPTSVTATALSWNSIRVNWTASTDNIGVAGYNIYRNGTKIGTSATTSYTDSTLQPGQTRSYTVSAYDASSNTSAQSSPPAVATTPSAGNHSANDDTYTFKADPGTNYDDDGIIVKVEPTRYGWVEFTFGTVSVTQATLHMYNMWAATGNHNVEIRGGSYNFNETTLTWSNQPDAASWTVLGTWNATAGAKWFTQDITSFYNSKLGQTVTFRLHSPSGTGDGPIFEDRENTKATGNRPYVSFVTCIPPTITTHPVSQVICTGKPVTFSVVSSGQPLNYQWRKNGSNISGATSSSYTISSVQAGDAASYNCYVYNSCGNATSNAATLTVNPVSAAPSNPGATGVTTSAITWTWQDNSSDEIGFKVYADPGAGPPTTLKTTTAASVTSWNYTGLSANTRYAFQVSSTNGTCESTRTANLAKYTIVLPPVFGSSGDAAVNCNKGSGGTSEWYLAGTEITFTAVNGIGAGQAKASKYLYVWNTSADEPSWASASEWTSGSLIKNESSTGSYYLHLRACNGDGLVNETTLKLGPYQIDADGPTTPVVIDNGDYTAATDGIYAKWSSTDAESGVVEYQYAVSASPTDGGIIPGGEWQSVGTAIEATRTGISLEYGQTYYVLVKAKNGAGMWSDVGATDGIMVVENIPDTGPLGMANIGVGGGDWFYNSETGAGQKGITDAVGLNTIGALVRTWGSFIYVDEASFRVDDGSGLEILCQVPDTVVLEPSWQYVVVTGISSSYKDGEILHRLILVRDQNDIVGF